MRYLFLLAAFFIVVPQAQAVDCSVHRVYCQIIKLQPRIDRNLAMELSNYIYYQAKAKDIDPMISLAILNQENRFRQEHTYKISRDIKEGCNETHCSKIVTEHHEVFDMGIAQINVSTAVYYGFDLQRLYDHDLKYAIECHFHILEDKMRNCYELGSEAWSCYHSATPKHRLNYVKLVSQYL